MADDQSKIIQKIRQRYLKEFRHIHKKPDRTRFFEEIGCMAEAAAISVWAEFASGMSAWLREDSSAAISHFERAIELDPEDAYPWHGKGNVFRLQKHYDEALAAYQKAIELDPEFPYPWDGKGRVLALQKRDDEALAVFEKAIELDPEFPNPWHGKGNVFRLQKTPRRGPGDIRKGH